MMEPDEDLKKFEEELKKPRVSTIKKDRIVTCPSCGKKQTMMQVALGEEVKCRKCSASFNLEKDMAENAHLVTMAAVDLQVKQVEFMQRVGKKVAPSSKKRITVSSPQVAKSSSSDTGAGKTILYIILLLLIAVVVLIGLHFVEVIDLQEYLKKIKDIVGL